MLLLARQAAEAGAQLARSLARWPYLDACHSRFDSHTRHQQDDDSCGPANKKQKPPSTNSISSPRLGPTGSRAKLARSHLKTEPLLRWAAVVVARSLGGNLGQRLARVGQGGSRFIWPWKRERAQPGGASPKQRLHCVLCERKVQVCGGRVKHASGPAQSGRPSAPALARPSPAVAAQEVLALARHTVAQRHGRQAQPQELSGAQK